MVAFGFLFNTCDLSIVTEIFLVVNMFHYKFHFHLIYLSQNNRQSIMPDIVGSAARQQGT